jgi:N-acetylmuramic acid 6-phosphate etherase
MSNNGPVTEAHRPELADLDIRSTRELVGLMNETDAEVAGAVAAAGDDLARAIDAIVARLEAGGRLVYVGAGTSGRLAELDAAECGPTFSAPDGQVVAVTIQGDAAEEEADAGTRAVAEANVTAADAVVGVSASGATPFTVAGTREAQRRGALTLAVVCAEDSPLARSTDHAVVAIVGPELVAGSTRLKAGTAQKLILNTISTVTMIRLGKTYGNLMVDVRAGSEKLWARARRAVELATGAGPEEAEAALSAADGAAKVAIVSLLLGIDADEARKRLEEASGGVRRAIAE